MNRSRENNEAEGPSPFTAINEEGDCLSSNVQQQHASSSCFVNGNDEMQHSTDNDGMTSEEIELMNNLLQESLLQAYSAESSQLAQSRSPQAFYDSSTLQPSSAANHGVQLQNNGFTNENNNTIHQYTNNSFRSTELPDDSLSNFKSDQEEPLPFDYPDGIVQNNDNNNWGDFLDKFIYEGDRANGTENEAKQVGGDLNHTVQISEQPALESLAAVNNNPSDSVFIGILEWVHAAKELPLNDYTESAVNLACLLTKRLYELSTSMETQVLRVNATNVSINVKRSHNDALQNGQSPMINEVNIQLTGLDTMSSFTSAKRQLECVSLGNILLEVFSKGESRSVDFSEDNKVGETSVNDGSDGEYGMPSISKRMASISMDTSMKSRATKLLLELGMPLSICRLVGDLLDAVNTKVSPKNPGAAISLDQALLDLVQMRDNSQMFLFDRTSPQQALDDTHLYDNLDGKLFGREEEIGTLMKAKSNISGYVGSTTQGGGFRCEAIFLGGYAGSGKSCLLRSLINACEEEQWFVLKCKFDRTVGVSIAKAFDDFFGQWNSTSAEGLNSQRDQTMMTSFHQICRTILSTIDPVAFSQLCDIVPNLAQIFPFGASSSSDHSPTGAVGSAEQSFLFMFNLLVKALCSAGRPVLLALDDLQWCDSIAMRSLTEIILHHTGFEGMCNQGLLIACTYRSNEVKEGDYIAQNFNLIKQSGKSNIAMISVDGLSAGDITEFLAAKLGLPLRYTHDLAKVVLSKSQGNPFFIIQFLKTIIHNKMLNFSMKSRRWTWDCDIVDIQMISDGVAELLTLTFDRLPVNLLQTLKIISLFGNQIDTSTIDQLNSGRRVLSFDMRSELSLAVEEGLLEKAGPIYQFTHDLIHQSLYDQTPPRNRRLLHKTVGAKILDSAANDHHMHLLAIDQINIFCKDGQLNDEERAKYANANATAAKYAMTASSFEKARSYVDMGMSLLAHDHWESEYNLSLDLYEKSASLCYMCGDTTRMASCLDELLTHTKSFEDSLNASAMLASLLSSSSRNREARTNCLDILSKLGEDFKPEPDLATVHSELSEIQPLLLTLTADRMKALPTMTDTIKLQAMKFMGMLCSIIGMCDPFLLPLLSVRMIKLTTQLGYCDDSIMGLFYIAHSMFLFTDHAALAYQVGKVGVTLREGSPNKHLLRSMLCAQWEANIKTMIEPLQAVVAEFPSVYESARLVGDLQNAMMCRYSHCALAFVCGEDLTVVSNHFRLCIKESAKYKQHVILNMAMAFYHVVLQVSGEDDTNVKSLDQLYNVGNESSNNVVLLIVLFSQLYIHFWFREYAAIMEICEKHPAPTAKRVHDTMRCFFQGIAALHLARQQPNDPKYRVVGEKAVKDVANFEQMNKWSFENKSLLLQAELHYLNQDYQAAEDSYLASIKSAKDHRFMNEEAMANELFGIFCIENQMFDKGTKHLHTALDFYKQWGAMRKAADLQQFIEDKIKVT